MDATVPQGFTPLERAGPFLQLFGPVYVRPTDAAPLLGLRIEDKHLNTRNIPHGGMMVALADTALGVALSASRRPRIPLVTVSLSTEFISSAQPGDWVEAHVEILRVGARMAYANCYLQVGERRILRASGVFAVMPPAEPTKERKEEFDG